MNAELFLSRPLSPDDPKRARILEGARTVFLAYGFQRSTMDDIARAAEVSRPALYLQFRNKSDIYRALAGEFLNAILACARDALEGEASVEEKLAELTAAMMGLMNAVEQSPHGAEILDVHNSLACDVLADWRTQMTGLIASAIGQDAARSGVDLAARGVSPELLADMLMDALDGMKARQIAASERVRAVGAYVRTITLAMRP